jgi:hypothetical protein
MILERLDLLADGRGSDVELARRVTKTRVTGHNLEGSE